MKSKWKQCLARPWTAVRKIRAWRLPVRGYRSAQARIGRSLRAQLLLTITVCLLAATVTYGVAEAVINQLFQRTVITYADGVLSIEWQAQQVADDFKQFNETVKHLDKADTDDWERRSYYGPLNYQEIVDTNRGLNFKVMIVDSSGQVLMRSPKATETKVELHDMFRRAMEGRGDFHPYTAREVVSVYPVTIYKGYELSYMHDRQPGYENEPLIVSRPPDAKVIEAYAVITDYPTPTIENVGGNNGLPVIPAAAVFLLLFYFLTKRKTKQIEELAGGLREIAIGHLDTRVPEKSRDEIGSLAADINFMAQELQQTIEEERRAEQTKSELITNVSHDLRTPLTSIMGYLRLVQDKKYETDEQLDEFIQIAAGKSERMKSLIEDLFEYTKLTNQGVRLHKRNVELTQMLEQLLEELVPLAEENGVSLHKKLPVESVQAFLDPNQIVRVWENLLTNAIHYSTRPGEVEATLQVEGDHLLFSVQNRADDLPDDMDLDRLFERFYKVEQARTSTTSRSGGSGLGLAIAKSIVDLHDGEIWAEREEDRIRFFVRLPLD
ncbi:MAG TPA: HAMP domain-containing sensor histidine kinase [Bacilli bacterium]|nr:HAMP domain-containing sensor histidine kinase [Bacilli bacterium]